MSRNKLVRASIVVGGLAMLLAGCAGPMALSDRECLTRAMYFESNRSSQDGMVAVGTTVMNRLAAPGYPKTVCGVVGQRGQYASGVLDKPMDPRQSEQIAQVADHVLAGERHPQVGSAMFFHTAGLTFPYHNMHYVAVAGGNAFYEKLEPNTFENTIGPVPRRVPSLVGAAAPMALSRAAPPRTLVDLIADAFRAQPRPRRRSSRRA